jgi:hypothetical protein
MKAAISDFRTSQDDHREPLEGVFFKAREKNE